MSVEELLEKTVNNTIKDAIKGARKSNMSEEQIATLLKNSYGAKIPEAELQKLLEETK